MRERGTNVVMGMAALIDSRQHHAAAMAVGLSNVTQKQAQQQAQGNRGATIDGAGVTNAGRARKSKAWSLHKPRHPAGR